MSRKKSIVTILVVLTITGLMICCIAAVAFSLIGYSSKTDPIRRLEFHGIDNTDGMIDLKAVHHSAIRNHYTVLTGRLPDGDIAKRLPNPTELEPEYFWLRPHVDDHRDSLDVVERYDLHYIYSHHSWSVEVSIDSKTGWFLLTAFLIDDE